MAPLLTPAVVVAAKLLEVMVCCGSAIFFELPPPLLNFSGIRNRRGSDDLNDFEIRLFVVVGGAAVALPADSSSRSEELPSGLYGELLIEFSITDLSS